MTRRFLVLTTLALGLACGIDDLLVGAACIEDADCPNLTCVRTATEAAEDEPGVCSADGACLQGEQAGCIADTNGMCSGSSLVPAAGPDGGSYCCPVGAGIPTVISVSEDDGTAACFGCPQCGSTSSSEEACMADDPRCELENEGDPCGCRLDDDALLGENCDGDEACGSSGVCTRTLEEQVEPNEPIEVDRALEQGVCRPSEAPACLQGGQSGCEVAAGSSCPSATTEVDVQTRSYCCEPPANSTDFQSLPYIVSDDLTSVACTACPRPNCDDAMGNPTLPVCTVLSDPACIVDSGLLCGCTPEG
ncbi:MAG: hypothetical protein KUG77_04600 [Nannocystaceae bacterium]|nr:hypothetical protein [Nannocystaceae bacterium]